MSAVSLNGWPVLDAGDPRLATGTIPGTTRQITCNKIALPLFLHFAAAWNTEMPQRLKLTDPRNEVDSWEVRQARAASGYSNHSSATATDFCYGRYLLADNQRHMSDQERTILSNILARYVTNDGHHVLANGAWWGKCDEMHTELSQGWDRGAKRNTTAADVEQVIARLRINPKGETVGTWVVSKIPPFIANFTVGSQQTAQVKAVQKGLGVVVDGQFGPKTLAALTAYQKAHLTLLLLPPTRAGVVNKRTYQALARPV